VNLADGADVHHDLLGIAAPHLPPHHGRIERSGFLIVRALIRDVIEPDSFPSGRLEWGRDVRGIALWAATLSAEKRRRDYRESERLQQFATREPTRIEFGKEPIEIRHATPRPEMDDAKSIRTPVIAEGCFR